MVTDKVGLFSSAFQNPLVELEFPKPQTHPNFHHFLRVVIRKGHSDRWAKGEFSHSARTAPIITPFIPVIPLKNHPPTEACMLNSKTVQLKRVVFSSSHLSKNMYWTQYIWVPCIKEHMKIY